MIDKKVKTLWSRNSNKNKVYCVAIIVHVVNYIQMIKKIYVAYKIINNIFILFCCGLNLLPYNEIGASFQQQPFQSIVVEFVFICFRIWPNSKYCQHVIIDENQLSQYYNILQIVKKYIKTYINTNESPESIPFYDPFSQQKLNQVQKVKRLTHVIYNHELQSFQGLI